MPIPQAGRCGYASTMLPAANNETIELTFFCFIDKESDILLILFIGFRVVLVENIPGSTG